MEYSELCISCYPAVVLKNYIFVSEKKEYKNSQKTAKGKFGTPFNFRMKLPSNVPEYHRFTSYINICLDHSIPAYACRITFLSSSLAFVGIIWPTRFDNYFIVFIFVPTNSISPTRRISISTYLIVEVVGFLDFLIKYVIKLFLKIYFEHFLWRIWNKNQSTLNSSCVTSVYSNLVMCTKFRSFCSRNDRFFSSYQ